MNALVTFFSAALLAACAYLFYRSTFSLCTRMENDHHQYLSFTSTQSLFKSIIIVIAMLGGAGNFVLRDSLLHIAILGSLISLITFLWLSRASKTTEFITESSAHDYLPTTAMVIAIGFVGVSYITYEQYFVWMMLTAAFFLCLYFFHSQDNTRFIKCVGMSTQAMIDSVPLNALIALISAIVACLLAYFTGGLIEGFAVTGSLGVLLIAIALFLPESLLAASLFNRNKMQSGLLLTLESVMITLLLCVPITTIATYYLNIENVTNLSDRQLLISTVIFLLMFFGCLKKQRIQPYLATLSGLLIIHLYLSL